MVIGNKFLRMAALAGGVASSALTVSVGEALAADTQVLSDGQVVSADEVVVNQTASYALVRQDDNNREGVTYRMYHDGKSMVYGLVIHGDGHLTLKGHAMTDYVERGMYEELRDHFPRTQPDMNDKHVPAVKYAQSHNLPIGGVNNANGFLNKGFDGSKGWVGSCSILDPQKILCLTNIYNDRASTYSAKIDVYMVDSYGNNASVNSADYSRPFNSDRERDRYERFVAKGEKGIMHYVR